MLTASAGAPRTWTMWPCLPALFTQGESLVSCVLSEGKREGCENNRFVQWLELVAGLQGK